jgi:hypothetical protein
MTMALAALLVPLVILARSRPADATPTGPLAGDGKSALGA